MTKNCSAIASVAIAGGIVGTIVHAVHVTGTSGLLLRSHEIDVPRCPKTLVSWRQGACQVARAACLQLACREHRCSRRTKLANIVDEGDVIQCGVGRHISANKETSTVVGSVVTDSQVLQHEVVVVEEDAACESA